MSSLSKLLCLALGAFAIGTEGYVVAGILPELATNLNVSLAAAGRLITIFALAYAVGSPILAVTTGAMERRRLLLASIAAFAVFNLVAALAPNYAILALARVGLAISAGTFMPAASAYAVATFPAERRGRALSIIYGGFTVAMVLGAPLGVMIGDHIGWRFIFVGVAVAAIVAWSGLAFTLSRLRPSATVTLAERIAIARRPDILGALLVTVLALAGVYTLYSFFAPLLDLTAGMKGDALALVLFIFGIGSTAGNLYGGVATDRFGPRRVIAAVLIALAGLFAVLSAVGLLLSPEVARWIIIPVVAAWGFVGFSFPSAQQTHLVTLAPRFAPITLSLNASAIYLGVSVGSLLGSIVVAHRSSLALGWCAAACEVVALIAFRLAPRRRRSEAPDEGGAVVETPVTELG